MYLVQVGNGHTQLQGRGKWVWALRHLRSMETKREQGEVQGLEEPVDLGLRQRQGQMSSRGPGRGLRSWALDQLQQSYWLQSALQQ